MIVSSSIDLECLSKMVILGFFLFVIYYFYRFKIYKISTLFLFKKLTFGNICIIEKRNELSENKIKEVEKEVLNLVNNPEDPTVILYVKDPKFYEAFFFLGEEGIGNSFVENHIETENLVELFEIIFNDNLEWKLHKQFVSLKLKRVTGTKLPMDFKHLDFVLNTEEEKMLSDKLAHYKVERTPPVFFEDDIDFNGFLSIVLHNGLFDFDNTFISKIIPVKFVEETEMNKLFYTENIKIRNQERLTNDYETTILESLKTETDYRNIYYYSFLSFLFKKGYLSFHHFIV